MTREKFIEFITSHRFQSIYKPENSEYLSFLNAWSNELNAGNFYTDKTKANWIYHNIKTAPTCKICGKPIIRNIESIKVGYPKTCSHDCRYKSMHLETRNTCIRLYGVTNNLHIKEVEEKIEADNLKKYGVKHPFLYGSTEFKQLMFDRYGDENYSNHEQARETNIKLYGDPNPTAYGKPKFKQKMLDNYGVEHACQKREFQLKAKQKYFYDNMYFDSAPEIAFYIWLKDMHIEFTYSPDVEIWYEFQNKRYRYYPDFLVGDQLVEIKGDQFFDKNGNMICPFKKKSWSDAQYKEKCEKYAIKYKCMIENNVIILKSTQYEEYLEYIEQTYGHDYIKQFKTSKKV